MTRCALLVGVLMSLGWAAPAWAGHSPQNCRGNDFKFSIERDRPNGIYSNGEMVQYSVHVSNIGTNTCDVNGVIMDVTLPAADGTDAGQTIRVVNGANIAAGTTEFTIATVPYKVAINPGVINTRAR